MSNLLTTLSFAINPWNPNLDFANPLFGTPAVNTIVVSGTTIYIGGSFTNVAAQPRNGLAAFNALTGALITTWDPNADGAVTALAVSGNTVYAGGRFLHIGNASRHGLAAINALDGAPTNFSTSTPGGVPYALAVSNGTLYVGGSFTQILSNVRYGIAAFDITGVLPIFTTWNPNSVLGYGGATIYALSATGGRVYLTVA